MGSAGTGKSKQLISVCEAIAPRLFYVIDTEDKLEAMLSVVGQPKNMKLHIAFSWEEAKEEWSKIEKVIKPGEWIAVDRFDLLWPAVQRWYTQEVYNESLADLMIDKIKKAQSKNSMLAQRMDKGGWQRINEEYETLTHKILYKSRANVLLTAGIKAADENSPQDVYGNLKILPRGQKELPHQPHSVFWLHQKKQGSVLSWYITTAKDLPGREYFESEELFDFASQYLQTYLPQTKG